jgi:hypothetical protein
MKAGASRIWDFQGGANDTLSDLIALYAVFYRS